MCLMVTIVYILEHSGKKKGILHLTVYFFGHICLSVMKSVEISSQKGVGISLSIHF